MTHESKLLGRSMLASLNGENFFEYKTLTHSLALETVVSDRNLTSKSVEVYRESILAYSPLLQVIIYSMMDSQ